MDIQKVIDALQLVATIVGISLFIWKSGRWTGQLQETLKHLIAKQGETAVTLTEHEAKDEVRFETLNEALIDTRVKLAEMRGRRLPGDSE